MTDKNKKKLDYNLKVREALEIKKENCGPGRGMNEDWGSYVKTDSWNPVFNTMDWAAGSARGRGPSPSWAFWSFDQSSCLSIQSSIISLSPLNSSPLSLSLILPLMMMPKVVLENLGKIVRFCYSALYSPSWNYKSFSVLYYRCLRWRSVTCH